MAASDIKIPQFYSQEDIQQILKLAIARQAHQEEFSREQLWEIATELEIPLELMQAAEQDWLAQQLLQQKLQAFDQYRRDKFRHKTGKYLIANAFFLCLDLLGGGGLDWYFYILLFSGFILALSAWKTYHNRGEAYERDFHKWERKRQLQDTVKTIWQSLQKAWQS